MKSVYTGGEKVAEFESYDELRVGDGKPAFIYEGNELVYPNTVKDGLVLWYDFSGRTNTDGQRGIAEDLSGNGNHGTLQNFNFTPESGYDKNKLLFDGVDDRVISKPINTNIYAIESVFIDGEIDKRVSLFTALKYNSPSSGLGLSISANRRGFVIDYGSEGITYTPHYFSNFSEASRILSKKNPIHAVLQIDLATNEATLYINGNHFETVLLSYKYNPLVSTVVGGNLANNITWDRFADGALMTGRVYNRPLTPEEIAHNYAIEKERFGIE